MDTINLLFSQYSLESIIILVLLIAVSIKFVTDLWEHFYNKAKKYFNFKDEKEERHNEILQRLDTLQKSTDAQHDINAKRDGQIKKISEQLDAQDKEALELRKTMSTQIQKFENLESRVHIVSEQLQDSTRAYIIDKHHHFCYRLHAIDDMSLQDLERRFMFYKSAGGDTFIDNLMEDVRKLPRITLEQITEEKGE